VLKWRTFAASQSKNMEFNKDEINRLIRSRRSHFPKQFAEGQRVTMPL
jgi:hypothetical protein